ncbi:hypothetical protein [Aminipila sp.]|uniref:hypothetical protein n=1 Tax=Aminipila sp. TaxID=2060095 RepID=UPI00289A66A7|nr:hypothetical protein [Aminipila sp.]
MDFKEEFDELNKIQYDLEFDDITEEEIRTFLLENKNDDKFLNAAFAIELLAEGFLKIYFNYLEALKEGKAQKIMEARDKLPRDLVKAHELQYPHQGELGDHIIEVYNRSGNEGVFGLLNGVKGKYYELKLEEMLLSDDPNSQVDILSSANFPVIDIIWNKSDNSNVIIQAKNYAEQQATDIVDTISGQSSKFTKLLDSEKGLQLLNEHPELQEMIDNQDISIVNYLTSEVGEKILSNYTELVDKVVVTPISNIKITEELNDYIMLIVNAYNIEIPEINLHIATDLVPYLSELVLGVKLLFDLASINKNFKLISATEKAKIGAVKVLVLFSRYGVRAVLTAIAGAGAFLVAGGATNPFSPFAGIAGGISGLVVSNKLCKIIMPNIINILYELLKITQEQAYYYEHKKDIDQLALEFSKVELN